MTLPSGRSLYYVKPRLEPNQYGGESVTYMGLDQSKKWNRQESYGPKFVENLIQAVSRDLLADTMSRLSNMLICGHIHDEIIVEAKESISVDDICAEMGKTPDWIKGLLLRADGYSCSYYMKD